MYSVYLISFAILLVKSLCAVAVNVREALAWEPTHVHVNVRQLRVVARQDVRVNMLGMVVGLNAGTHVGVDVAAKHVCVRYAQMVKRVQWRLDARAIGSYPPRRTFHVLRPLATYAFDMGSTCGRSGRASTRVRSCQARMSKSGQTSMVRRVVCIEYVGQMWLPTCLQLQELMSLGEGK